MPAATRHTLTVLALNHRIHKLSVQSCHGDTKALILRRHEHLGHAIALLRESIDAGLLGDKCGTITSIMIFNKTEVCEFRSTRLYLSYMLQLMYSDLVDWRGHVRASLHLISLGGGLQKVYKSDAQFRIPILTIML